MTNWLFFGLCTLVDLAISVLFPGNFLMNDLVFLPSVGFCSLVLVIREEMLFDRCLTAFLYGLLVDLFVTDTFLLHASVYLLIALLLQLWSRHMGDSDAGIHHPLHCDDFRQGSAGILIHEGQWRKRDAVCRMDREL